ncbi:MAG TPA: hypothetical protein VL400_03965 [Polyangiaceae bacterium]|nr:hypothetical protein [Polyangiaceae bacterium]
MSTPSDTERNVLDSTRLGAAEADGGAELVARDDAEGAVDGGAVAALPWVSAPPPSGVDTVSVELGREHPRTTRASTAAKTGAAFTR